MSSLSFNMFCILIILPCFSLFVFANITSYFSLFLVCILWCFSFKGKRSFSLSFFIPDWANFKLRFFLLISKESRFNILKECFLCLNHLYSLVSVSCSILFNLVLSISYSLYKWQSVTTLEYPLRG